MPLQDLQFSGARVRSLVNQNFAPSTTLALTYDTVDYDTDGYFNNLQPDRLTVPVPGVYGFGAEVRWAGVSSGGRIASIIDVSNNRTHVEQWQLSNNQAALYHNLYTEQWLEAGAPLKVHLFQSSSATLNTFAVVHHAPAFFIRLLGVAAIGYRK